MTDGFICPGCQTQFLTTKSASHIAGYKESTLRAWIREGILKPEGQLGNSYVLSKSALFSTLEMLGYDRVEKFTTREER